MTTADRDAAICKALRAGEYAVDVARAFDMAADTVRKIAKKNAVVIKAMPPGLRWGKKAKVVVVQRTMTLEEHYAGMKHSLRWGGGFGI